MLGLFHPLLLPLWLVSSRGGPLARAGVLHARQVTIIEGNPSAGASKCGPQANGAVYSCPTREPCCHPNGYCVGAGDSYCYVAEGCLAKYSARSNHCQKGQPWSDGGHPDDPTLPISDGTVCGVDGADKLWGACPNKKGARCCASSGRCGEDSDHCLVSGGCQSTFGVCWDESPLRQPPPVQEAEPDPESEAEADPETEPEEPPPDDEDQDQDGSRGGDAGQDRGGSRGGVGDGSGSGRGGWGAGKIGGGSGSGAGGSYGGGRGGGSGGQDRGGSGGWGGWAEDDEGESDEWDWEEDHEDDGGWWWDETGSAPQATASPS